MLRLRLSITLVALLAPLAAHAFDPGLGSGGDGNQTTDGTNDVVNNYAIINSPLSGSGTVSVAGGQGDQLQQR